MRIRWTAPAAADLELIKDYLKRHHPNFAQPTVRRIYESPFSQNFSLSYPRWA